MLLNYKIIIKLILIFIIDLKNHSKQSLRFHN